MEPSVLSHKEIKKPRRWRLGKAALYFFVPIIVFILTSVPGLNRVTPIVVLLAIGLLIAARFISTWPRSATIMVWTVLVLSLVGSTGWFFSPFFFTLYLIAIGLGFLYTPIVAVTFTVALILLFASSVGEVSATADFLTLVSLWSVIPITIGLRRSFLLVQQEQRGILILETDEKTSGITSLDAVLRNQVNRIAILIRQPITYIRQALALLHQNVLSEEEKKEVLERMGRSADEVFTLIKEFESDKTKNTLLGRTKDHHHAS